MKKETKDQFTKVEKPSDVAVGDQLAWESYNSDYSDNLYWAKVTKVTPKSVVVDTPDADSYKQRTQTWRMRPIYSTGPEYFEPWGNASGTLYRMTSGDAPAAVQAAYDKRAADKKAKEALNAALDAERTERIARDHAEAWASNPGVAWEQFTALGNELYYHSHILNSHGAVVLAVVSVMRVQNDSWKVDEVKAHPFIWKAAVNYSEMRSQDYGPSTMGSISDVKADSLDELFREVVYRLWR